MGMRQFNSNFEGSSRQRKSEDRYTEGRLRLEDYQVSGFQVSGFGFYVSTVSSVEIRK
jgi:hypothetical protein